MIKKYKFTEEQSEAIVTLQLYRLSNTDIGALENENKILNNTINDLNLILHNEEDLQRVVKDELQSIIKILATPRRSEIETEIEKITITKEELVTEEQVFIGITRQGYVKKSTPRSYKATETPGLKDDDSMLFVDQVSTLDTMLIFTNKGNYIYLPVFEVPDYKWKDLGTHINNIVQLEEDEQIIKILHVEAFNLDQHLFFVTKLNLIKLTKLEEFNVSRYSKTIKAINLNKNDEVVGIDLTDSLDKEVLIVSNRGLGLRMSMSEVPITSTTAKGVKGMNLPQKHKLASGIVLEDHNDLLVLTHRGTIKRVNVLDIPKKKRTNKGVQIYKEVKSNPFMVIDLCLMNATQYKNRAKIKVNTTKAIVDINAFDVKTDRTGNGKSFVKPRFGKPLFLNIEKFEIDETITVLSEYVKEKDLDLIQQKLFE